MARGARQQGDFTLKGHQALSETLSPRQRLVAVPYAVRATTAESAETVDGVPLLFITQAFADFAFDGAAPPNQDPSEGTGDTDGDLLPNFLDDGHMTAPASPWRPTELDGVERRELSELLVRSIDQLPESYRDVLLLRDIEELDTEETAEAMGISPGAVKTRLHRARQALRGLLSPHLEEAAA